MKWKNKLKSPLSQIKSPFTRVWIGVFSSLLLSFVSNFYLQLAQNNWSFHLATKFAFSWHTEKFLLGMLVLFVLNLFLVSLSGSFVIGNLFYGVGIAILGIADAIKMSYRMEPVYPDEVKMIFEWNMLRDILGLPIFLLFMVLVIVIVLFLGYSFYKSLKLPPFWQKIRIIMLVLTSFLLFYISEFNEPNNLLKKAYDRTALWVPYSQKMNYYNTGFIGGFLFNLKVEGMDKPNGYSKEKINEIVTNYQKKAKKVNETNTDDEQPNVIYVMSESFSDPLRLKGFTLTPDPISDYRDVANESVYSGQMLSQGYGGGTANMEFEALTGFSMALLNPQMTTPYTMLMSKEKSFPSMVSNLKAQNYETTAIHPYNTSMYKRKDVYKTFGFDSFIDEDTMTYQDTLSEGGYISDESAFHEVLDVLANDKTPQFVHLVTMQTHMPYNNKYKNSDYTVSGTTNQKSIENYSQDIAYTSEAFKAFIEKIDELKRPTILVFWGDHLPGIYGEDVLEENDDVTTHLTEYLVYDTRENGPTIKQTISPFYFPSVVTQASGVKATAFSEMLSEMHEIMPAFEKGRYYYDGKWQKEVTLSEEEQRIYDDYELIQYDMISGEKYSEKMFQ